LDEIDARVETEILQAVEFAEASPEPGMDELFKDIYADAD
jgi:TPP-dependent pyruvate/acetoin dehydrogenase alpha subunit